MKCCRCVFFFYGYGEHRDLPLLTHSFPTRRSSELLALEIEGRLVGRDVDRAGRRILAIERALRPAQHLDLRAVEEIEGRGSDARIIDRSDEHTSELQSLMRISYAVFCSHKYTYPVLTIPSEDS